MPKSETYNLVVLGGGSGGLVCAAGAAGLGARVALLEKEKMGGECLNTGCVPSKALIRSAKIFSYIQNADKYGIDVSQAKPDFARVMERVQRVIQTIEPHDSVERFRSLGVDVHLGAGHFDGTHVIANAKRSFKAKKVVISTGSSPFVPPIPGLDQVPYLTNENIWSLTSLPKRLAVLGGGPIGVELAQAFARFGSEVTVVEMVPQLLFREDEDAAEVLTQKLESEGLTLLTGFKATAVKKSNGQKTLVAENKEGKTAEVPFDEILVAVGRKPNLGSLNLEKVGIEFTPKGLVVDPFLRTTQKHVFGCGDVAGPYLFTHTASYQAEYILRNAFFPFPKKVDYSVVPWCTFTDPEIARVGLNEKEAKEKNVDYDAFCYPLDSLDRAICDDETRGFVKVLTEKGSDKLLGVTMVGYHAGDLLHEFVLSMKQGIGLGGITGTIHVYPTMAEAVRRSADNWRRTKLTPLLKKAFTFYFKLFR